MNQDHGSASYSRKRIDLPPPRSLTTRLVPVEVDLNQQIFDVCSCFNNGVHQRGGLRQLCAKNGRAAIPIGCPLKPKVDALTRSPSSARARSVGGMSIPSRFGLRTLSHGLVLPVP